VTSPTVERGHILRCKVLVQVWDPVEGYGGEQANSDRSTMR
jgi:hypothetical protein